MSQSSRELVRRALRFEHPERLPRQLWTLPWANIHHPGTVAELERRYPADIEICQYFYRPSQRAEGDPYRVGTSTDAWGCVFRNIQPGMIGEVDEPILANMADAAAYRPPCEQLPKAGSREWSEAQDVISRFHAGTDRFVFANIDTRPWERYQFLRGTENALVDVLMPESGMTDLLQKIHGFYLRELEFWCAADVDAIPLADDWGTQSNLLINPDLWREHFKPLYREYCEMARAHGKFVFLHSDGFVTDIYEDLIEIGIDAVNSQLFCMDMGELARIGKGRITFWGEIDRQKVLTSENPEDGRAAVREVARHLYDPAGGIIAQFEFGAGANPETVMVIFDEWEKVHREATR
ncbi:MAG: uroporphyrinogen decarboxylase family protein [Candidatus Krumholzibacteriota bacterium]